MYPPKPDYLRKVRELCNQNGALLIFDEAKTGVKIAYGGGPEYSGVAPDITCLAKAIGGGFPIGAMAASDELMELISSGTVWQTGSFAANPVSVAANCHAPRCIDQRPLPFLVYTESATRERL